MAAEIVHNDDVAGTECGDQDLFDIGSEGLAIDWGVKKPRSLDPIVAQCRQECCRFPVAVRNFGREPHAARRPTPQRRHVGFGPGFVDEDQPLRLDAVLILCPLRPPPCDVGAIPFASHYGFF